MVFAVVTEATHANLIFLPAAPRSSTPRDVIVKPKREADMGTANLTRNEKVKSEPDTEPLKANKKPDTKKIKGKSAKPEPSYSTINIKEEPVRIGVTIKAEHVEDDQLKFISLVKRENGKGIDMFNLDNLDLGPNIKVEERAHTGWTRKVISDVSNPLKNNIIIPYAIFVGLRW